MAGGSNNPPPRRRRPANYDPNSNYNPTMMGWDPKSQADAEVLNRFAKEPPTSPLKIIIDGSTLDLPKYNGIAWFFPKRRRRRHALETFFCYVFTITNAVQTSSLFIIPITLMAQYGIWYTLASLLLTVPVGNYLEDAFGPNFGSAYTSVMCLQLSFASLSAIMNFFLMARDPNPFIVIAAFLSQMYASGIVLCWMEKHVCGRTWNAALLAYTQLAYWFAKILMLLNDGSGQE